jgi:cellobiose epimerase
MLNDRTNILKELARKEVISNILPYWENNMVDNDNGGFYGSINFYGKLDKYASKGAVLNTRILWTFSKAYNVLGDKKYLELADRAYNYIDKNFRDPEFNGVYWELDYKGNLVNTQKYCYTQGFWIYAMSEYYLATKDKKVLEQALAIFKILEDKAVDRKRNGYVEAFARDWTVTGNVRISEKDLNENKTYNTHLHILEAYAALYRISKDSKVEKALENLIILMAEKFYNPSN